jgi:hypothetical protein
MKFYVPIEIDVPEGFAANLDRDGTLTLIQRPPPPAEALEAAPPAETSPPLGSLTVESTRELLGAGTPVRVKQATDPIAMRGQMNQIPRRARMDLWIPAERAINDALQSVEALGAHPDLTAVVIKLGESQRAIADWYDGGAPGAAPSENGDGGTGS